MSRQLRLFRMALEFRQAGNRPIYVLARRCHKNTMYSTATLLRTKTFLRLLALIASLCALGANAANETDFNEALLLFAAIYVDWTSFVDGVVCGDISIH